MIIESIIDSENTDRFIAKSKKMEGMNMSNQARETLAGRYLAAKKALFDKKYSFLNEKQREAVYTIHGPLLVLAAAPARSPAAPPLSRRCAGSAVPPA